VTFRSFDLALAVRPAALVAAALLAAAPTARAQFVVRRGPPADEATRVYEWRGRVDREIRLRLRDDDASVYRVGSNESRVGSGRVLRALPRERGQLTVQRLEGRGIVDVVQQPNGSNDYTAVLRLRDPAGGADSYHLVAYWRPVDGWAGKTTPNEDDWVRGGRIERGDGDRRDDDWRDGRRRDGDWRDDRRDARLGAYLRGISLTRLQEERIDRVWDSRAPRDQRLARVRTLLTRDQQRRFDRNRAQVERRVGWGDGRNEE
jgi:hypothetical protein